MQLLYRLRHLPPPDELRLLGWGVLGEVRRLAPQPRVRPVSRDELERWFGPAAPVLHHTGFGREATGPPFGTIEPLPVSSGAVTLDARVSWEGERDQDLFALVTAGLLDHRLVDRGPAIVERAQRVMTAAPPNAMEAALRSITWLQVLRFAVPAKAADGVMLERLARWLLRMGFLIERRLHEVPLGGNHLLSHAVGLLHLGRLLPGRPETTHWAERGRRIVEREALQQFHSDGGGYEGSTAYHLFSLELLLSAALLLHGQGETLSMPARERIRAAARFAAAIARPDGSIPLLGDDDSGRVLRWSDEPPVRVVCALAAMLVDDAELAVAAHGCSVAASWLWGTGAQERLQTLAATAGNLAPSSRSFERTGLHVLRDATAHAVLWCRDPSPPAMLAHSHADHNTVDIWCAGTHVVRDPGAGLYTADPALRNLLRASGAHSTVTLDSTEICCFRSDDLFFMPPSTRGRRLQWEVTTSAQTAVATHDGFRGLPGAPLHRRSLTLLRDTGAVVVEDDVRSTRVSASPHRVTAWWHWGEEQGDVREEAEGDVVRWRFRVGSCSVELTVPSETRVTHGEPFPWAASFGDVREGSRTVVEWAGLLPFTSRLVIRPDQP